MNVNKLRGKIAEKCMTQKEVAARIGLDNSTFARKMKAGGLPFTVGQMHSLAEALSLTNDEARDIFLSENSQ